jgi:hypothetical protein
MKDDVIKVLIDVGIVITLIGSIVAFLYVTWP